MLSLARVSGMQLNCGLHFFPICRYLDGEDSSGDSLSDIVQVLDAMVHHCKEVNKIYKLEEDGKEEQQILSWCEGVAEQVSGGSADR